MRLQKLFSEQGLEKTLETIYPAVYHSKHVKRKVPTNNGVVRFAKTMGQIVYLTIKKRRKLTLNNTCRVLFYSPNQKYDIFCSVFENQFVEDSLTISEGSYTESTIDPHEIVTFTSNRIALLKIYPMILSVRKIAVKNNELALFKEQYWLILSALRRDFFLHLLFKKTQFNYFFSFHPQGDLDQLINTLYTDKFKERFAIRPTTTYFDKENEYIKTGVLFYTSEREKNIYLKNVSSEINLLSGGIILPERTIGIEKDRKSILFVDTCTNYLENSSAIREKAVSEFIEFAKEHELTVYFKFHPGLLNELKNKTLSLIESLNYDKIQVVNNLPLEKNNICISFDSTVMYQCIQHDILVFNFQGDYDMIPDAEPEFLDNSIPLIHNKNDLQQLLTYISNDKLFNDLQLKQKDWLRVIHNYPEGITKMIAFLKK